MDGSCGFPNLLLALWFTFLPLTIITSHKYLAVTGRSGQWIISPVLIINDHMAPGSVHLQKALECYHP